ncbi:hypothetical protein MMS20_28145 [Escherichia coli]|nr:hypothetical protein [Escherichia coli]MCM4875773.1 hypothetical protein [Escherichia coli]MCM5421000.1 hypothetical protein [Escherichia coli]MCM5437522.1 hypothetical protein [Escherichia coli]MCM5454150.1 hypothetical protein [Escherichia coli]
MHVSNGGIRLFQLSGFFIALRFVGERVVTVMVCCQPQRTTANRQDNNHHTQNTVHLSFTPPVPITSGLARRWKRKWQPA